MTGAALCGAAMAFFAAGMHRHGRAVTGRARTEPALRRLRIVGWALLALSAATIVAAPAWPIALVEWIGVVSAAALLATAVVSIRPRALIPCAGAALLVAILVDVAAPK